MAKMLEIKSKAEFEGLLKESRIVVADFYADWCGPCKTIAPIYARLSESLSRPKHITFTKVNVDQQQELAKTYEVTAMPTFIVFVEGKIVEKITGADPKKLQNALQKLAAEATGGASSSEGFGAVSGSGNDWRIGELPKGYKDVTDQLDIKGLELLNADREYAGVRTLFEGAKPSAISKGKRADTEGKDWVESDTDEQLMLFLPFQSTLKVHTLQITSLPPTKDDDNDDEIPMRPRKLQLYPNRPHILGFDEADDVPAAQIIELDSSEWDASGTINIPLRFVKFQNVTSLVIFIVDGDGEGEKVRVDRVRIIGETGEKRDPGELKKIEE